MKKVIFVFLIFCFSLTIISCSDEEEEYTATATTTTDNTTTTSDTTAPTVLSISPTDNQSGVSISENILVTFSEAMDTTSVTTNTSNTTCSGSLQLSSDNFSSCFQMSSSPSNSNSDKTFTVDPSGSLLYSTSYKIRVTTGVKDASGNTMSSQYETSIGFTTTGLFVAVGNSGKILTSDNGTSWDNRSSGTTSTLIGVTYGNNKFMTMSGDKTGTMLTSSNGTSWTSTSWTCSSCTDNSSYYTLNDVTYKE